MTTIQRITGEQLNAMINIKAQMINNLENRMGFSKRYAGLYANCLVHAKDMNEVIDAENQL